ncbi:unnamed protein product [Camellia sinensis]
MPWGTPTQSMMTKKRGEEYFYTEEAKALLNAWPSQTIISIYHTLEVWAKEREVAGLRASLNTLMSEIQRLNKLCTERKEAEDSLRKKGKKIEEFDGRRSELESIYNALLKISSETVNQEWVCIVQSWS